MSDNEDFDSAPEEKGEKGPGRPGIEWTEEQEDMIRRLAEIHCTQSEIAYVMKVSVDSIQRHAKDIMAEGKAQGKVKLRRAQWRNAIEDNNTTMQIWLGKNILGQTDQPLNDESSIILPWEKE